MITIQASRHPLVDDWVLAEVAPNQTLAEICGTTQIHAWIDGQAIDAELLETLRLEDGVFVIVRPVPADDGIFRAVLMLGAVLAGAWLGGAAAGGLFGIKAGFALNVAHAVGALALSSLVNVLVPLPQPSLVSSADTSFNRLQSLTGASNQVARFQPIPRVYGRHRFYPPIPMTAMPFTEIEGSDQYLRMMVILGYGPLDIGGVRVGGPTDGVITRLTELSGTPIVIGETDIHAFSDVEFEIGRPDQITLYTDQVIEINPAWTTRTDVSGFAADARGRWVANGDSAVRSTEPDTDEISITVEGSLFTIDSKGRTTWGKVDWLVEYSPYGQNTWTIVENPWRVSSIKRETARFGLRWSVPRGQYDVRLTRLQTYFNNFEATSDEMTWTALRSIRSRTPWNEPGTVVMALRIRASDQLNGVIDELAVTATSILPVWNGSTWIEQATRNPAWIFADIWTGTANRRPVDKSRLDVDALLAWADDCGVRGFHYDRVFDDAGTTLERAVEVAACGRASWNVTNDAKISIVRDVPQATPKMVIGPRNSFGFQYALRNADVPDALRVQFVDPNTWDNTERLVFDDGYDESNAQKYDTLEARGVTDPDHAWKFGRYNLAQLKLRPETFTFNQDVQHLRYNRGDLLEYRHDVIAVGLADGRVREVLTNTEGLVTSFRSDEFLPMPDPGKDYGIRIQRNDGTIWTVSLIYAYPGTDMPVLAAPASIAVDDYFLFGELGRESIRVKVTAIEPQGDLVAQVTCVPEAPDIHDADTGAIPPYDPGITAPPDPARMQIPPPVLRRIVSDESVLMPDANGAVKIRIVIEVSFTSFSGWSMAWQARYRPLTTDGNASPWMVSELTTKDNLSLFEVEQGIVYEIQVRSVRGTVVSDWTPSVHHYVEGKMRPPHDVTGFVATAARDRIMLSWNAVPDPDCGGYEVREGESWEQGALLVILSGTSYQTARPSNGPWWIKAFDTNVTPNYSVNAAKAQINVVPPVSSQLKTQVIDNNVRLQWTTVLGTFDLRTHEIRVGSDLVTADVVGLSDKTFDIIQEVQGGTYTYWVVPIDAAGNAGTATGAVVEVSDPPDFVLSNKFQTDWEGDVASSILQDVSAPLPYRLTVVDTTAREFDGVDDSVWVPYHSAFDLSVYTYEFLLYPFEQNTDYAPIMVKGDGAVATGQNPAIYLRPDGRITFAQSTGSGQVVAETTPWSVQSGRWHRVSCVRSSTNMLIYIDGVQKASVAVGAVEQPVGGTAECLETVDTNTNPLYIAGLPDARNFAGRLADLRVWNIARSAADIAASVRKTLRGDEAGLVAYWRAQSIMGSNVLIDMAPGGHNGNIVGALEYTPEVRAIAPTANYSRDQLIALGYASRDAMIAAGLNYRAHPSPSSAQFVEVYDAGTILPNTNIRATLDMAPIVGDVTPVVTISTKRSITDAWTDFPVGQNPVFAQDFRYVKLTVDFAGVNAFALLNEVNTTLSMQLINDAGTVTVVSNPTTVAFNASFIDVQSITVTPQGTGALSAIVDFDDVPYPESFKLWLFDNSGNPATGVVRWAARGV